MKSVTIIYGTNTGTTEDVAKIIKNKLSDHTVTMLDVAKASVKDIDEAQNLILGTSTWGFGDVQDDWESFLPQLKKAELNNKTVALFGLGDSASYGDSFASGMNTLYQVLLEKNCNIVGQTPTEGYDFSYSDAVVDGLFVGLAIDEDNEHDQTEKRITQWLEGVTAKFAV